MTVKAVIARVCPAYGRHLEQKTLQTQNKLIEQELAVKREILSKYLENLKLNKSVIYENFLNIEALSSTKISDLLSRFGNNVAQIHTLFGEYGLAAYAQILPDSIIKDAKNNIKEYAYATNKTIKNSFCNYLILNGTGANKEISRRFGLAGDMLLEEYSRSGILKFSESNNSYHVPEERKHYLALLAAGKEGAFNSMNLYEGYKYYIK